MKIRTGFVSNSSSSSFVIIGVPIKDWKEEYEDFKHDTLDYLYVEERNCDYIFGYVIAQEEYFGFSETSFEEMKKIAEEIVEIHPEFSEKDVKIYTGTRPC